MHMSVSRKMLADRGHSGLVQSVHQCAGQLGDGMRIVMKGAIANHATLSHVHVEDRRETQVYAMCLQFGGEDKSQVRRNPARLLRTAIPASAQLSHRRQDREPIAEPLNPSALMIDSDKQRGISQSMYLRA